MAFEAFGSRGITGYLHRIYTQRDEATRVEPGWLCGASNLGLAPGIYLEMGWQLYYLFTPSLGLFVC